MNVTKLVRGGNGTLLIVAQTVEQRVGFLQIKADVVIATGHKVRTSHESITSNDRNSVAFLLTVHADICANPVHV